MKYQRHGIVVLVAIACLFVWSVANPVGAEDGSKAAQVKDHPDFDDLSNPPGDQHQPSGMTVLSWDDGTGETGLGVNINGNYDGVVGVRFGGSPATTGALPMAIRGAYFHLFAGFGGATQVQVNFWHPLAGAAPQLPVNPTPIAGVPAGTTTGATVFASTPAGPTISTANGSVLAGVNVLGVSSWFVSGDTSMTGRGYFGSGSTIEVPPTLGAATLSTIVTPANYLVRLLVDGNVPVELQRFTVD